jgi:hypothetical protein
MAKEFKQVFSVQGPFLSREGARNKYILIIQQFPVKNPDYFTPFSPDVKWIFGDGNMETWEIAELMGGGEPHSDKNI